MLMIYRLVCKGSGSCCIDSKTSRLRTIINCTFCSKLVALQQRCNWPAKPRPMTCLLVLLSLIKGISDEQKLVFTIKFYLSSKSHFTKKHCSYSTRDLIEYCLVFVVFLESCVFHSYIVNLLQVIRIADICLV